jgi:XrtJ-associated TM-motif-TM protein
MKKYALVLALLALASAAPLHALTVGCENSPEDPTVFLGLIGIAGVAAAHFRNRFKS